MCCYILCKDLVLPSLQQTFLDPSNYIYLSYSRTHWGIQFFRLLQEKDLVNGIRMANEYLSLYKLKKALVICHLPTIHQCFLLCGM